VDPSLPSKLCRPQDVELCVRMLPRPLVFTNGVFDLLHRGHVTYLAAARALGRSLVVGLNSDLSVLGLGKGPGRPINNELDRAWVLDGLASVTMIVLFDEAKPLELMARVRPDVYVKGGDYDMAGLEETRLVASWSGSAQAIDYVPGYSTTSLVERLQAAAPMRSAA
jgi:rfaE bifunctional protein nucleotidyltransferase chain/domain